MHFSLIALLVALLSLLLVAPGSAAASPGPDLDARAWILLDSRSGDVLADRSSERALPGASTTKLMTARLALEELRPAQLVPAPSYVANPIESRIDLRPGEQMTVRDLLHALLLESANDAAVALATAASGSVGRFVQEMNSEARTLGLERTSFRNPIGLDEPGHATSAADLAELTRELMRDPVFRGIVATESATLRSGDRTRRLVTRNDLLRRLPWLNGVKTGHTQAAGYVLVASGRRGGVELISVVLGTGSEDERDSESERLLRWGFAQYRREEAVEAGEALARAEVRYRDEPLTLVAGEPVQVTMRRGQEIVTDVDAPAQVEGPIAEGELLGAARVLVDGTERARVTLRAAAPVQAPSIVTRAREDAPVDPLLAGVGVVIIGMGAFMARRRSPRAREGPQA